MVAALAAPVMAAPPPLTLDVTIGDGCVNGTAKPNTFVKVVIRDAGGTAEGSRGRDRRHDRIVVGVRGFFRGPDRRG